MSVASHLGMSPAAYDTGQRRSGALLPPNPSTIREIVALPNGGIGVIDERVSPAIFQVIDSTTGRTRNPSGPQGFFDPAAGSYNVATDSSGNLYQIVTGTNPGVYKRDPLGNLKFDFTAVGAPSACMAAGYIPLEIAVDSSGRVYGITATELRVYGSEGTLQTTLTLSSGDGNAKELTVAPDGSRVFVATDGTKIARYDRSGSTFARQWATSAFVVSSILDISAKSSTQLAVVFSGAVSNAMVREYTVGSSGLTDLRGIGGVMNTTTPDYALGDTTIELRNGMITYVAQGKLMQLDPNGIQTPTKLYQAGGPRADRWPLAFGFGPDGDAYFVYNDDPNSSSIGRGAIVYRSDWNGSTWGAQVMVDADPVAAGTQKFDASPYNMATDLAIDSNGRLLLRISGSDQTIDLYWAQPGQANEHVVNLGAGLQDYQSYGIQLASNGQYFTGGSARSIVALDSAGNEQWTRRHYQHQGYYSTPLRQTRAITTDSHGNVWVADQARSDIYCYSPTGTLLNVYGQWGDADDRDGLSFNRITGLATIIDAGGKEWLYVADVGGHRIVRLMIATPSASVADRYVFYNNSYFDGNDAAANAADDAAIATSKSALLPGGTASFANYTSYSRGINGVMLDIAGLPADLTAADFVFRIGNSNTPNSWAAGPLPSVSVRRSAGNGTDRVTLTWPDGAIQKQWLQVTVLSTANTGLAGADVFYFGNAIGECGDSASNAFVDATDQVLVRDHPRGFLDRAEVSYPYDINRDSFVDATDMVLVRDNTTNFLTALKLIGVPAMGAGSVRAPRAPERTPVRQTAFAAAMTPSASAPASVTPHSQTRRLTMHRVGDEIELPLPL